MTDKLADAKQALEEEALRRAQLEAQLQAAESQKAVHEDELAIRRMYEDLTGFTVTEVTMHDSSQSSRRYEMVFTGTDYFGMLGALTVRSPICLGGIAPAFRAEWPWRANTGRLHLHSARRRNTRRRTLGFREYA